MNIQKSKNFIQMKRIRIIGLLFLSVLFTSATAQSKWSLQECVDHARENNISLKLQKKFTADKHLLQQYESNRMLPSASARIGLSENFSNSGSSNNTYVNSNSFIGGFNLEASAILFRGFAIQNAVKRSRAEYEAAEYDVKTAENDMLLLVLQAYMDVLLKKEIVVVAEEQLTITNEEKKAVKIKYDVGELSKDVYLENLAQEAREMAILEEARNNVIYARLVLAHILDLENPESFDVISVGMSNVNEDVELYSTTQLFDEVKVDWPGIKSAEKQLESAEYMIAEAKSAYYPTVTAYAGYSTNYYYYQGDSIQNASFSNQLSGNSMPTVGVNINIPLFSQFNNDINVKRAKINQDVKALELEQIENQLRETLKEAYVSAVASHSRFESAKKTLDATTESFRFAEEKYKVGALSPYDYNTAKSQLAKAESELVQAKYQFVFAARVLEFYKNNTIEL